MICTKSLTSPVITHRLLSIEKIFIYGLLSLTIVKKLKYYPALLEIDIMMNKSLKKSFLSHWHVIFIIPILIITIASMIDNENNDIIDDIEIDIAVGFYISGESFSDDIIDNDISDTLGLCSERNQFYYLVDYNGFGNTEFFTGLNYSRKYINISEFMPFDSNELNMGDKETFNGFAQYVNDIDAKFHCLVIWGHGKGSEGVCFDGSSSLKSEDIESLLIETDYDLVVFDACEMGSLEFLYGIRDYSGLIVASEKDIPDRGIDYSNGFYSFIEMGSSDAYDLGKCLVDSTIDYYSRNPSLFSVQLSIINNYKIDKLYEFYNSIDAGSLEVKPEFLESGIRVDLCEYLYLNGYYNISYLIKDIVIYSRSFKSHMGINVENLCGISIKTY